MIIFFSLDGLICVAIVILFIVCGGIHEGVLFLLEHPSIFIFVGLLNAIASLISCFIKKAKLSHVILSVMCSILFCVALYTGFKDMNNLYLLKGKDFNNVIGLFLHRAIYISTFFIVVLSFSLMSMASLFFEENIFLVLNLIAFCLFIVATALITYRNGFEEWLVMALSGAVCCFSYVIADNL